MHTTVHTPSQTTKELILRIQPLMEAVDLEDMPPSLKQSMNHIEKATGITTLDYAKRLLVLNAKGEITDNEYIELVRELA